MSPNSEMHPYSLLASHSLVVALVDLQTAMPNKTASDISFCRLEPWNPGTYDDMLLDAPNSGGSPVPEPNASERLWPPTFGTPNCRPALNSCLKPRFHSKVREGPFAHHSRNHNGQTNDQLGLHANDLGEMRLQHNC